jgi:hypothetical protein
MKKLFFLVLTIALALSETPSIVYQYRVFCITENQNVYQWNTAAPTQCPNNNTHTINPNSISIIDQVSSNAVKIQTESVPTGGYFKCQSHTFSADPNTTTTTQISWPFNISLMTVFCTTTTDQEGDVITAEVPSNIIVGLITQDVTAGDTQISVSQTVLANIAIGFHISLTDGVQLNQMGRIIDIDKIAGKLTLETAATNSFAAANPTYVRMSIIPIENLEFGPAQTYTLGQSSLGASHIPANTPIVIKYTNNGSSTKKMVINYQYLY